MPPNLLNRCILPPLILRVPTASRLSPKRVISASLEFTLEVTDGVMGG